MHMPPAETANLLQVSLVAAIVAVFVVLLVTVVNGHTSERHYRRIEALNVFNLLRTRVAQLWHFFRL
jgi:hypothetical protein